jgi:hypothetical protein
LKEAAVRKAGGTTLLAKALGVTAGAVSQWARTRPIPRHARARLEQYIQEGRLLAGEFEDEPKRTPGRSLAPDVVTWLSRFLTSGPSLDLGLYSRLPPRYQRRLKERVKELQDRLRTDLEGLRSQLEREVSEYQRLLRAESAKRTR